MSLLQQIESGAVLRPRRMLIYGTRGVGLSTFAASFPEPVFVPVDDSLHHIDCRRFPIAQRFGQVLAALRELYNEPHGYRTVVIDPLDSLERLILDEVRRDRGVDSIESIPLGKGHALALDPWRELLTALDALRDDLGMACLLIGRAATERTADASTGSTLLVDRHGPALHRHASALIQSWCDEVLFATTADQTCGGSAERLPSGQQSDVRDAQRVLYTAPARTHAAKNHLSLPPVIPMDIRVLAPHIAVPKHPMSSLN